MPAEAGDARGYVLRSPHAHARIRAIDVGQARAAPGVLAVLTGEDLSRRGLGTLMPGVRRRRRNGTPAFVCPQPLLAQERVRYVGDPVAFVVADTLDQAKDAAELIEIDYEPLPAVITAAAALAPGAPAVWDENPGNEAFFHEVGNKEAVDAAFASADRIVRDEIRINRVTANSMEPRGCIADYDRDQDRYTIRCTIQSVHATRAALADRIFQAAAAPVPGGLRQYGRRLRHEGRLLSGIRAVAVGLRGQSAGRCAGFPSAAKGWRATSRAAAASSTPSLRSTGRPISRIAGTVAGGDRRLLFDRPTDDTR